MGEDRPGRGLRSTESRSARMGDRVMTDPRNLMKCQECGTYVEGTAYHSWVFCLLHKEGWSRGLIIQEMREAVAATAQERVKVKR